MGGSNVYFEMGETQTVEDMIKCIAIASANDGAVAMGEHLAGSEEAFVALMNKRAKELGMNNTNTNKLIKQYEGSTGLKTGSTSLAKLKQ